MDLIDGIPAHPLIVHLPVVLIPLALIGVVLMLIRPSWRRASWVVAALAFVGFVGGYLAEGSGESLERRVEESSKLEDHAEQGELVPPMAGIFFLTTLGIAGLEVLRRRQASAEAANGADALNSTNSTLSTPSADKARVIGTAVTVAALLTGSVATYAVYSAGHSGARVAWEDAAQVTPRAEGGEREEGDEGGESGEGDEYGAGTNAPG